MTVDAPLDKELNRLPALGKGSVIHLLGVGGVGMASLAGLLAGEGYRVTGADENLYPPMSDLVRDLGIPVTGGYGPESLDPRPDAVVVGNVVTARFPVVSALREKRIPYVSFPRCLSELFLRDAKNLVVAGTHGKTTITNLCARLFDSGGFAPGFLVGGLSLDFPFPFRKAGGDRFVIEGDEYDSAFFDKVPKFVHYRPETVILTSSDFDHADIYEDLDAVVRAFESLVRLIPEGGLLIANGSDPTVRKISASARSRVLYYGEDPDCDWRLGDFVPEGRGSSFEVGGPGDFTLRLSWGKIGKHNALGAVAAVAAFAEAGGDPGFLPEAFRELGGVRRRQELVRESGDGTLLFDDFAHHPRAVSVTLNAFREAFPDRRILALFEPRSNTTRRAVFQDDYARAFARADRVFLSRVDRPEKAPEGDRLDLEKLRKDIGKARISESPREMVEAVMGELKPGDVLVSMSNGNFGGLVAMLDAALKAKGL
ncbi:MAG: Mur ligase domain-containing protein [Deltaproteobacteria bacterium]|jgi:UDP-N-acetylmuramate: L-alanyl-gamma-D-glutamyl-meso-diaminopimelate ligase|nr:Mur ligase domain-containing protein [Deltaproteobacteria bacterium]